MLPTPSLLLLTTPLASLHAPPAACSLRSHTARLPWARQWAARGKPAAGLGEMLGSLDQGSSLQAGHRRNTQQADPPRLPAPEVLAAEIPNTTKRRKSTCPGSDVTTAPPGARCRGDGTNPRRLRVDVLSVTRGCDRWWGTERGSNRREAGPMPGRKSSKEKKRRRSRSSGLDGGSGAGGTEGKRRSTESSYSLLEEIKCTVPSAEKEELAEEHSDIEDGGLDLSVSLKPVSFYIADKKEMLHQCFCVIGEKKLQKMLPDVLKNCSMEEIKRLCLDQLELLSEKKLLKILEGETGADSDTDEDADRGGNKTGVESISQVSATSVMWDNYIS
ncbi:caspase activity and apoptosis inhibitor 1 isoform X2 [Chrysemys picta bellii]|uniref:caspase activity and apoptosis inhibitor 1 isoform X2 n=1 Tax=Chrysemys picta bellii TaxID=8478 RepID=UPI0032B1BA8B